MARHNYSRATNIRILAAQATDHGVWLNALLILMRAGEADAAYLLTVPMAHHARALLNAFPL